MSVGIYIAPANFVFMVVNHKFLFLWRQFSFRSCFPKNIFTFFKNIFSESSTQLGAQFRYKITYFSRLKIRNNHGLEKFIAKAQCFMYSSERIKILFVQISSVDAKKFGI